MTKAQIDMLTKASEAAEWYIFHCARYSVARALFRRGMVKLHNFRDGHYGVKLTEVGRSYLNERTVG